MTIFVLLMLAGTLALGADDVLKRKYLREGMDEQILLGISWFGGGLLLLIPLFIFGIPEIKSGFWSAFFATTFLNVVSQNIFIRAFKIADASLIAPLRLLIPPIVIFTGFLVLGEVPTITGALGILTTIAGLWLLLPSGGNDSGVEERAALRQGMIFGIMGSILFAFSFPFDKKAVVASSGIFFSSLVLIAVGILTIAGSMIFFKNSRISFFRDAVRWRRSLVLVSLAGGIGSFLTAQALGYSLAAYAASMKRLWSLWTVILAGKFLEERDLKRRLVATLIMLSGVAITAIWG
ncbi:MAG: DMT family transporter [Candidatus Sungbacteria bacterium]|nr:DMT family transporter [Candidatus Sungbacteria bacterium]